MKRAWFMCLCGLAVLTLFLFTACEVESSADTQLNLNPMSATLHNGQSAQFTVSGGYDYRWSMKDETKGTLNTRTGDQVIYTCQMNASSNSFNQELYVESYIIGASGNNPTNIVGSNTTAKITATAYITQLP